MKYAQQWHRQISQIASVILIFFCVSIFMLYQFFIFAQLKAKKFTREAEGYLKRAEELEGKEIIVEEAIFYKRALRLLVQAIKFNPLDASAYFTYAESINSKIGKDERIINMLDLDSLHWDSREKNFDLIGLVRHSFTEALKRDPTNAIYHQRLASVYERLSDESSAESELKKAVLLDPQNVSIHLYLTQYYLSRNKQKEFNYHLGRVVELYKLALTGGGSMEHLANMVRQYLDSIKQLDLIKNY